jgi:hypothetical protein
MCSKCESSVRVERAFSCLKTRKSVLSSGSRIYCRPTDRHTPSTTRPWHCNGCCGDDRDYQIVAMPCGQILGYISSTVVFPFTTNTRPQLVSPLHLGQVFATPFTCSFSACYKSSALNMSTPTTDLKSSDFHDEHTKEDIAPFKTDPHGFPLRPQPTDDPLGWCLKWLFTDNADFSKILSTGLNR